MHFKIFVNFTFFCYFVKAILEISYTHQQSKNYIFSIFNNSMKKVFLYFHEVCKISLIFLSLSASLSLSVFFCFSLGVSVSLYLFLCLCLSLSLCLYNSRRHF
uniref:Uncharacterized protein n=1 Tax=Mus musculus TaxID=10090 RepID=Q8BQ92_MOUSE|nr:unnamed protein product [Mus musculus]